MKRFSKIFKQKENKNKKLNNPTKQHFKLYLKWFNGSRQNDFK
jgi:hypothetical protein